MQKVLTIGWDGATWEYIDPLLKAGRLPNLAALQGNGARFTLRSTVPPYTNVAWPSLVTGLTPAHTGVTDATRAQPGSYEALPSNLLSYRGTPMWRWLNQFGLRCGILNVPMTFPAPPLDGYLVSGFDSIVASPEIAYPRDLLAQWRESGRTYTILQEETALMDGQNPHHSRGDLASFVQRWNDLTRRQGEFAAWLWQEWPVEMMFVVFSGTDSINHRTHDREAIARVYEAADAALGQLREAAGDETLICLVSDHGSTRAHHYLSVYRALYDGGWLRFKAEVAGRYRQRLPSLLARIVEAGWARLPAGARRLLSWPLLRWDARLASSYDNIDWQKTAVYARTGMGALYVNRQDVRAHGIVSAGDYERLRDEVIRVLEGLCDEGGKRLFAMVRRFEEVYAGEAPAEDDRPDLLFVPERWSDHPITGFASDPLRRPIPDSTPYGTHTRDGILLLHGPGVAQGTAGGAADIFDVAPTIYAALDLPLPVNLDGRPLEEAFARALQLRWAEALPDEGRAQGATGTDAEGGREIGDRLRALGYME